jgi:hypothetical protein
MTDKVQRRAGTQSGRETSAAVGGGGGDLARTALLVLEES